MSTAPAPFRSADRINHSLTAALESRLLLFMARRLPSCVKPDHLTALGLLAQVAAGVLFGAARVWRPALLLIGPCLLLNWLGDSLDGTVARVRDQQRPRFGFYVDHVVDMLGATAMMSGMAVSGFVHGSTALGMLVAFLLLAGESYLATYTVGQFALSPGLFGPTEIRVLLSIGALALFHSPVAHLFGHAWMLFDVGGVIAIVCMLSTLIVQVVRHTVCLFQEERLS